MNALERAPRTLGQYRVLKKGSVVHLNKFFCSSRVSYPRVGLLGVLEDRNGSFMAGPRHAPALIREQLHCSSGNSFSEEGVDIATAMKDCGDVRPESSSMQSLFEIVEPKLRNIISEQSLMPLMLGGDHSISSSLVKAVSKTLASPLYIVHFDAHPDIYEDFEGNPSSHASQFARVLEQNGLCAGLISIGIRTLTPHQRQQCEKYNVAVIEAKDFPSHGSGVRTLLEERMPDKTIPAYISFDIDAIDPSLAPGVSHREPGGLSVRQAIDAIHAIPGRVIAADVVEYNPLRDLLGQGQGQGQEGEAPSTGMMMGVPDRLTARVVAKLVREIAARMVLSSP